MELTFAIVLRQLWGGGPSDEDSSAGDVNTPNPKHTELPSHTTLGFFDEQLGSAVGAIDYMSGSWI